MGRRLSLLLLAVVLTAASLFMSPKAANAAKVYVALTTTYYSDSTFTTVVGVCSYANCMQFDQGNWHCTGSSSSYGRGSNYTYCPPPF